VVTFRLRDATPDVELVRARNSSGGWRIMLTDNNEIRGEFDDGTNNVAIRPPLWSAGQGMLVQVALIRDTTANDVQMFVNGSNDRTGARASDPTGDITSSQGLLVWDGNVDVFDLQCFSRVVSREELQSWHLQTLGSNVFEGDLRGLDAGKGVVTTTPDGTAQYRVRVDNSGNVVTDQL
jgi:hypothetical protein